MVVFLPTRDFHGKLKSKFDHDSVNRVSTVEVVMKHIPRRYPSLEKLSLELEPTAKHQLDRLIGIFVSFINRDEFVGVKDPTIGEARSLLDCCVLDFGSQLFAHPTRSSWAC